mgnify:CR=1 FL=1
MEFLYDYGLFAIKLITVVVSIVAVIAMLAAARDKQSGAGAKGFLEIIRLNEQYDDMRESVMLATLNEAEQKVQAKALDEARKEKHKADKKAAKRNATDDIARRRVYVLNFDGNVSASAVEHLREEITAVLSQATESDEVVLKLESAGGMVHSYGLAASQLDRLRKKKIPLTVCVDKVAASGGYMMACVADRILAAPFAVLGSIGVIAQLPNFNRVLKKNQIDFELLTAGEYKRTLTVFGENTAAGREKFVQELEETHQLFKDYVTERRPAVDVVQVATGEVWYGSRALEVSLVDDLQTSDEYLVECVGSADVFEINYVLKKSLAERFGIAAETSVDRLLLKWWQRLTRASHKLL